MSVTEDHSHHVRLHEDGTEGTGPDADELVPARPLGGELYKVLATPGIVLGCAAGDTVRVDADGRFAVVGRGGNVAVHIYAKPALEQRDVDDLRRRFEAIRGLVEAPAHLRFAVVTVPVSAGFPAIEAALHAWMSTRTGTEWFFGNVYDDDDVPLRWWDGDYGAAFPSPDDGEHPGAG